MKRRTPEFHLAENFFLSCSMNGRWWNSFKAEAKDYFNQLLEKCPVMSEQDFNDWLYSKDSSTLNRPKDIKISSGVHAMFIMWRNRCFREKLQNETKEC